MKLLMRFNIFRHAFVFLYSDLLYCPWRKIAEIPPASSSHRLAYSYINKTKFLPCFSILSLYECVYISGCSYETLTIENHLGPVGFWFFRATG